MTIPASIETDISPLAIPNNLFPDLSEQLPVMITHVYGLFDTILMLRVGSFQEDVRDIGALRYHPGEDRIPEWDQHQRYKYHNGETAYTPAAFIP
jgi:hypothetical protein